MRHLTISTALITGCLIAGAAWAQGSSSSSSSGGAGSASSTAAPSAGSSSSSTATQPNNSTLRPPGQVAPGNSGQSGNTEVRGTPGTLTGNGTNQDSSAATGGSGSPPGSQGSTGGPATSANRSSTDPDTTGGVAGVNRLQPGERSAVAPTAREEELFRKGEELEQKAREGICSNCGAKP